MQKSIWLGFLCGFGALVVSILIDSQFHFGAILAFFNVSAMVIIFGGITGAIIVAFPPDHLKEIPNGLRKAFTDERGIDPVDMLVQILGLAQKARQEGILSLENDLPEIKDDWLRRGLQLAVDGLDRQLINDLLETEFQEFERRTQTAARIFQALGGFAPTLGIIGTVMGLVHMLANLEDSSKIGGAIAVAFLATFWGILSANLIFLPIAERVKTRDEEILGTRQAMVQGILAIQAGEPVRIIEEKMKVFLNPEQSAAFTERLAVSGGARRGGGA